MSGSKKYKIKRYAYTAVSFLFVLVCLTVGIVSFQYYNRLQKTIREESSGYLQELSKRIGNNIDRIIKDNYSVLETLESILETQNLDSFDSISPVVEIQKSYWNYKDILMIDENGVAYDSSGHQVVLNANVYLKNAVLNNTQSMSTSQMVGNEEMVVFAVPLDNLIIDGKKMVAMASSYAPDVFARELEMSAFDGNATSTIISKEGAVIIGSSSDKAFKTGYNVLNTLSKANFKDRKDVQAIQIDMQGDLVGQVEFTYNNTDTYMVYTPINPEAWYLLTFVPVEVANAKTTMLLRITVMLCGFITILFAGLTAFLLYNFYRNQSKLEHLAYVDEVTGGNSIQKFYQLAELALQEVDHPSYALIYTNIEKFKIMNEQIGRSSCDLMLAAFYECVEMDLKDRECIGRLSADNFCILVKFVGEADLLGRIEGWYKNGEAFAARKNSIRAIPVTEFGVLIIDNDNVSFAQMIDRAKLSLRRAVRSINGKVRYAFYDDQLRRSLFREKQLEDMMDTALQEGEFQVYLQPKYKLPEEKIGGAEALARWDSVSEGMIYPDEFVPLFEKNGFIIQLDLWVFETVCKTLREWIDGGKEPVKISVNCSRVHLQDPDFMKPYKKTAEKHHIPHGLLEIELTESIVMDDADQLCKVIDQIHDAGFGCSMDDFGSGYSSLNLIQSIPVDTLKMDKIFFRSKDHARVQSVVGGITTMAKALSMETVAEGVEYREHVEMLKLVGCDYIQGYVFAKPMPIPDFEKLLFGSEENMG